MSNATRWYATREAIKAVLSISGADSDRLVDSYIESVSEEIESLLARWFIPRTLTRDYRWPQPQGYDKCRLELDADLLAVTGLTKDDDDVTAVAASDYFLEPLNSGPPYDRIEIDLSSSAFFSWANTPQRAVRVTGRWGYREDTKAAGALAAAISSTSATSLNCSDASLIGVGDTLLLDSEAIFVSERAWLDTTADLNDTLTADESDVTVTVTDGTKVQVAEVILVDSERMLVNGITGNNLTVDRAVDGSVLAAHSGAVNIYASRTLTIVRGVNGTTAATHLNAAAIVKYAPPADIVDLCRALVLARFEQGRGGWTGQIGGGEAGVQPRMFNVWAFREDVKKRYRRWFF